MAGAREAARSLETASLFPAKIVETLGADRVITSSEVRRFNFFSFDPDGSARNLDLPAEAQCKGVFVFISNEADGAEIITIRDDGGSTLATPTQDEAAVLWCDGVTWFGLVGASS